MATSADGIVLCEHITEVLNTLITSTGKQIDKNEPKIWDDFLHQLTNDEWESMFMAFKEVVAKHDILLTNHQQRKFDEAYTTFQKDKLKRESCMDIRNKFMNTKQLAWGMIMTIREVINQVNKKEVPNVDTAKPVVKTKPRVTVESTAESTTITIWHNLFDISH